jgi:hypothetical protein
MCHPGGNPPVESLAGPAMIAPGATGEYTFTPKTDRTCGALDVAVGDLGQYGEAFDAFKRAYWNYEEPSFL